MKKDVAHTLKRADKLNVILIGEGLLVGITGGGIALLYRIMLSYAGKALNWVLDFARGVPWRMILWLVVLAALAFIVGRLVKWEPLISGSGIPQLEGEMTGKLEQTWWRVMIAKLAGGCLALLGGLSLGREGPSIQLGAMAGKGISRLLERGKTEEKFLLTCGASAGLSAAFHAPLAGVMFSLEEVHKNFSVSVLVSVMTASLTADFMASHVLGLDPVFQFDIGRELPLKYYWVIILLGILLGVLGAFYNYVTLKVQELYQRPKCLNESARLLIPFLMAGVLGFTMPEVLGSGHELVEMITHENMVLGTVLVLLGIKFLFSAISFGSGAPGGIFFPLLVLGAFIGGAFGIAGAEFFGLEAEYINNFILLAMAGYFTAIVRAPLTGIILIFEMTGTVDQMLSLSLVSIVAYIVATLLRSTPIYESLLERLLEKRGIQTPKTMGQKVLSEYVVMHGSEINGQLVRELPLPENCLLVAIQRGGKEIIPKGKTRVFASDTLITMTDERDAGTVHDKMEKLCSEE